MVGRYGGRTGLRHVAVAAVLALSLIAPAAISAQESDQPAPSPAEAPAAPPTAAAPALPDDPAQAASPEPAPPVATDTATAPASAPPAPPAAEPAPVTVSRASASATRAVSIVDFAYSPGALTVTSGDSVTWTNKDAAPEGHDVTGDGLDSGLMNQGDTYSFTFNSAGSYSYICTIHPSMTGSVEVLARSGGGGDTDSGSTSGTDSADAVTESEAISSPDAAGTAVSLPATGEPLGSLATASLLLLALGLALRALVPGRARG